MPKSYFPFSKPDEKSATLAINKGGFDQEQKVPYDHAFVLVGAEVPVQFLKSLGIRMENEWIGSFWKSAAPVLATLVGLWYAGGQTGMLPETLAPTFAILGGALCLLAFAMLLILGMHGERCWAFRFWSGTRFTARNWVPARSSGGNWGYNALSFFDRPWSFWYTVLYTFLMTFFGIQALKRWGLDRKDRFQVWRFISLLAFQWIFFFIIPEFLFQCGEIPVGGRTGERSGICRSSLAQLQADLCLAAVFLHLLLQPAPDLGHLSIAAPASPSARWMCCRLHRRETAHHSWCRLGVKQ